MGFNLEFTVSFVKSERVIEKLEFRAFVEVVKSNGVAVAESKIFLIEGFRITDFVFNLVFKYCAI